MAKDEEYKFPDEIETKAGKDEEKVEYEIEGESTLRYGPDGLPLFDQNDDDNLRKMETKIQDGE